MTRIASIGDGDTNQWNVLEWAFQQAQYLTPTQHHVLLYLVCHAFYAADNPEGGEVGQVMRQASYVESMTAGTGLKRMAIRNALTALQTSGYVQREVRKDKAVYGQQPHMIYVLWEADELREGLRNGSRRLPKELLSIPTRPAAKTTPRPVLTLVRETETGS